MRMQLATYSRLPTEVRMQAPGLPLQRKSRPGRERELSFKQRFRVAMDWGERWNAHARSAELTKRQRRVLKLLKEIETLRAEGAPAHRIARVSALMDALGRSYSTPIEPPKELKPVVDREVAKAFGITERMVRRCRTDPRMHPFMPHPVWEQRYYEIKSRNDETARQLARKLMSPERLAKGESIAFVTTA